MGEELSYFDMAENDYFYLLDDYERRKVGNVFVMFHRVFVRDT